MNHSIVYSSQTGNTELLAEAIRERLPRPLYFGAPAARALDDGRIYAGFWTDRGSCDAASAEFLKTLTDQEVFLFGTAGFGGDPGYFEKILASVRENLAPGVKVIGCFMCQGKMPMAVRRRYESMPPQAAARVPMLLENFDRALSHPDRRDLDALIHALEACL